MPVGNLAIHGVPRQVMEEDDSRLHGFGVNVPDLAIERSASFPVIEMFMLTSRQALGEHGAVSRRRRMMKRVEGETSTCLAAARREGANISRLPALFSRDINTST